MTGFSPRNLKYMRQFCEAWPDRAIVQRTVAQLPWRSNLTLLDKLDDPQIRLWYAQKALELGMGKDMLVFQIESRLHERQGQTSGMFVYFYVATKFGAHAMENSVKATVDSLRLPTFLEFELSIPPTLGEQTAIAAILSDMDTELAELQSRLTKAREIKQGMMQELLTGRDTVDLTLCN